MGGGGKAKTVPVYLVALACVLSRLCLPLCVKPLHRPSEKEPKEIERKGADGASRSSTLSKSTCTLLLMLMFIRGLLFFYIYMFLSVVKTSALLRFAVSMYSCLAKPMLQCHLLFWPVPKLYSQHEGTVVGQLFPTSPHQLRYEVSMAADPLCNDGTVWNIPTH